MGTTIIKNTHIKELLEVSRGNMDVLKKMTEEFRQLVHLGKKVATIRRTSMTTQRAINIVNEIIRENRENGELDGVLIRHRIAALIHLVRIAEEGKIEAESSQFNESQRRS